MIDPPIGIVDYDFFGVAISTINWWRVWAEFFTFAATFGPLIYRRRKGSKIRRDAWIAITVYTVMNLGLLIGR